MIQHCPDPSMWLQRITESIIDEGECWRWIRACDRYGYGRFAYRLDGSMHETGAHRASWLAHHGTIPTGLEIDHLCRNRWCVNPRHMELVTHRINVNRGRRPKPGEPPQYPPRQKRAYPPPPRVFQCRRHGQENGYIFLSKQGNKSWVCRICVRNKQARRRAVKKLLAASNP